MGELKTYLVTMKLTIDTDTHASPNEWDWQTLLGGLPRPPDIVTVLENAETLLPLRVVNVSQEE